MNKEHPSMSLATSASNANLHLTQKISIFGIGIALLIFLLATLNIYLPNAEMLMWSSIILLLISAVLYSRATYLHHPEGIKNNKVFFRSFTNRGVLGILFGVFLTGFYIILYWFPQYLGLGMNGEANTGLIHFFDPLCNLLEGKAASQWFVYGTFYTLLILAMGYKFILKYRHNNYQIVRTISVMFFQLAFAFLLPEFLIKMNHPYNDFKNMWPLNYYFFDDWHIKELIKDGNLGLLMLVFGIAMIFIISPILTYFYGKRWYCSWVCGCGGLAETAGDPFRQLSDKSLKVWKFERILIHTVLVFSFIMTAAVLYSFTVQNPDSFILNRTMLTGIVSFILIVIAIILYFNKKVIQNISRTVKIIAVILIIFILASILYNYQSGNKEVFSINAVLLRKWYGFYIGSLFSGVIGVGFYPIFGSRVWCRFGCPMAAILGLQQRFFSRFRITTNGAQCISCGNCSTYCEMGIDVRSYAQRNQNIVRASCVGCGICAAVCPRGVLKLEAGPNNSRRTEIQFTSQSFIASEDVNILKH